MFYNMPSTAVSIQSLVVMAIDRFRGVVFPFRPPLITSRVCKVFIVVIWIVAMCIHAPYFYALRLVIKVNKWHCTFFSWAPNLDERRTQERYFVFVSIFLIFLSLCVILSLYILIFRDLKKRKLNANRALDIRCQRQRKREDTAIVKRIIIIVSLFVLCITPITVLALVFYFVWNWHIPCGMDKLFAAAKFIFYSNASLNPCVYIILSERFRQGWKD